MVVFPKSKFLIALVLGFSIMHLSAQNKQVLDSLKNCIQNCEEVSARIEALIDYVNISKDYEANLRMLDSTIQARKGSPVDSIRLKLYLAKSANQYYNDHYRAAIKTALQLRELAKKTRETIYVITINNNLNQLYYRLSMPDSSFYYLNENYEYLLHSTDTTNIFANLNGLGLYYLREDNYTKARTYFQQNKYLAKAISALSERKRLLSVAYGNLGLLYNHWNKLDSAEYYLKKKLEILPNDLGAINGLGSVAKEKGDYEKALEYYRIVYDSAKKNENAYALSASANNLAMTYNLQGNHKKAVNFAIKGENTSRKIGRLDWVVVGLNEQAVAMEAMGNYKKALALTERMHKLRDSIKSVEVRKNMASLETTYQLKEKSTALELAKAQNEIQDLSLSRAQWRNRLSLAVVILILIVAAILIVYNRRLNKTRKKLAEANDLKDRFFAIIAHDLRGGMASFTWIFPVLEQMAEEKDYEGIKQISHQLKEESLRAEKMLDSLLKWAFLQLDRINMKPEKVDLEAVVKERLEELGYTLKSKKIVVDMDIEATQLHTDPVALTFILRNLLSNAVKFSHLGGEISIGSIKKDKEVQINITDHGTGMDPKTIKNLFDPGEKVSHKGTAGESGNGLGLVLSKEFAERNKGRLQVESKSGKGTTFKLYFPIKDKAA